jgi:hypothetical protein
MHKIQKMTEEDILEDDANLDEEFEFLNDQEFPKVILGMEEKGSIKILYCNSCFSSCLGYSKNQLTR